MRAARVPEAPDFKAIEDAAAPYAERQQRILMLIGTLGLNWSNNESMFIYVLMLLLNVEEVDAAIVFATLNTTRARLDLVRRLAAVKLRDPATAQVLARLIKRFEGATKVRNEFNHCMYVLNEKGEITHTQLMRPHEEKGRLTLGDVKEMHAGRITQITEVIRQLKRLNRDVWAFLPQLQAALRRQEEAAKVAASSSSATFK